MHYRFKLEPHPPGSKNKYQCPACKDNDRTFTRYIDTETGKQLAEHVGRCDREGSCGYHLPPRDYLKDAGITLTAARPRVAEPVKVSPASYHEPELLTKYGHRHTNGLTEYLAATFGKEATKLLIDRYRIGTYGKYTLFWQIDLSGRMRAAKLIQYDATRGKRTGQTTWLHAKLKLHDYHLRQCLFGEHLLHDRQRHVAIVESEKTAIIASHLLPEMLWLATGGKHGLNAEKLKPLQGRTVVLYPDLGAFNEWQAKAQELAGLATFTVSEVLEQEATEEDRQNGLDIADLLLRELSEYSVEESMTPLPPAEQSSTPHEMTWQDRLESLRSYFATVQTKGVDVKVNEWHTIADIGSWLPAYFKAAETSKREPERTKFIERLEFIQTAIHETTFVNNRE